MIVISLDLLNFINIRIITITIFHWSWIFYFWLIDKATNLPHKVWCSQKKDMRKLTLSYDPTYSQTDKSILDTYENSGKKKNNFVQYSQAFISAFRKCRVNIEQAILISMTVSFPVSSENCLYILLPEARIHQATIARQYVRREIV